MKATRLLGIAVLGLTLAAPLSFGQNAPAAKPAGERPGAAVLAMLRDGSGPIDKIKEFLDTLDLSDTQKEQVKTVLDDVKAQWDTWRDNHKDEIEKLKADFIAAREAKDPDKIKALLEKVKDLTKDAPKPGEALEKIKEILTPEQQAKLEAKIKEMREARQDRRAGDNAPAAK